MAPKQCICILWASCTTSKISISESPRGESDHTDPSKYFFPGQKELRCLRIGFSYVFFLSLASDFGGLKLFDTSKLFLKSTKIWVGMRIWQVTRELIRLMRHPSPIFIVIVSWCSVTPKTIRFCKKLRPEGPYSRIFKSDGMPKESHHKR